MEIDSYEFKKLLHIRTYSQIEDIDEEMIGLLYTLNKKGYVTQASCQGHCDNNGHFRIQLVFSHQYPFEVLPPINDYELWEGGLLDGCLSIEYEGFNGEEEREDILAKWYEWANNLETRIPMAKEVAYSIVVITKGGRRIYLKTYVNNKLKAYLEYTKIKVKGKYKDVKLIRKIIKEW